MDIKNKPVEFNKTTFYKGLNATYGKIPVKLEIYMDFQDDGGFKRGHSSIIKPFGGRGVSPYLIKLGLFAGMDKMYRVSDIGHFLEALEGLHPYYFSKNFILEPAKMYFEKVDKKILEFLSNLKIRRKYNSMEFDSERQELHTNEVVLDEDESEKLLDFIWDDTGSIRLCKQSDKFRFENDISIKITIEKKDEFNLMSMDYSEYGDFEPVAINFRYIAFKDKRLIVKLPEGKRDVFMNLYHFKNEENVVIFRIGVNEKKLFQRNFIDKYRDEFKIFMDSAVKKEIMASSLLSRVYFDVAPKGIVSKIEFCYADKIINPLDDVEANKSFREFDSEKKVIAELKVFGFREHGRLFLLDDIEKIMFLLTDSLKELKKISEVYYSEDFKKLYVKNLSGLGLSLSEDGSVIHMNINLENVSDEELAELLDAVNKGKKYYRLRNGSIINLSSVESSKFIDLINSLEINKNSIHGGVFEIPLNRCLYIDNYLREKGVENVEIESRLGCLMKSVSNPEDFEIELNEPLKGILRSYQLVGVKWLKSMASYSFGGILADDMGLGKTLQVLAFIASEKKRDLPCMVVAPTSIVYNWKMEAEKFTPELRVLVVTGTKDKRTLQICGCNEYDLVITSYGALKNDIEDYKKIKFSYIFVDEAQNIKNPMTLNANSVKSLKAKCCFALTGTPIENRLTEIWSIFDFIMPGYLFNRNKFVNTYEDPIIREKNSDKMNELSSLIKPFIIRRLKKDVLSELPEKIETNYISEMTDKQKKLYAAYYKDLKNELIAKIDEYGIEKNHIEILSALTRLRQICAHPGTFLDDYDGGSCKLDLAMEIITESINSSHSILLFSQFTKMLKIIRDELENNNINYYYLDGSMKPEERTMEIDNFNSDREAVFLISLKAGGTGLNLTKADIIIHFDPWWNPAVEDQASDRAHRIGQKNVVQVYKLLTEGTIEEKIAQLQERKRDLIESIIKPGESFLNKLSEEEIRELFEIAPASI
ncbi:DEAD/DEAH box helicase [Candidatus Parcubacteria bacterium]|nr:MAG: DEAD/DEAH box helicase [Candidatus Parcubacteria bacterium]